MFSQFLYNPENGYPHSHAAQICETSKGLHAVWYAYPEEEYQEARLVEAFLPHGERDWQKSSFLF